jgi:hypothetical protein
LIHFNINTMTLLGAELIEIYIYSVHTCTFIDLCMYTNMTNSQQNNS